MLGRRQFTFLHLWIFLCTVIGSQVVLTMKTADSVLFLARYGYISKSSMTEGIMNMTEVAGGLKMYQKYTGIPVTGTLNNKTMGMMKAPRCGNTDTSVVNEMKSEGIRRKRFLVNSKWEKRLITYKIINYPDCCLSQDTVDRETQEAFEAWINVIGLEGLKIERRLRHEVVDIDIKFTTGPHNDNMKFGSTGNGDRTVAHAFYPQQDQNHHIRGDIHFNIREAWTSKSKKGQNYLQTAMHEIGHSLGLDHSMEHSAVMYAMVPPFDPEFQLHADDIEGIQYLYTEEPEPMGDTPKTELEIQPRFKLPTQQAALIPNIIDQSSDTSTAISTTSTRSPIQIPEWYPFSCNFHDRWSCTSYPKNTLTCCSHSVWYIKYSVSIL